MLIKLPIIKDKIISKVNFTLEKFGNKISLKLLNNTQNNYEIFISNLDFCLTKLTIEFPLELEIIDDKLLYSKFYFIIAFMDKFNCELDFFSILLKNINKTFSICEFINLDYIYNNFYFLMKKNIINIDIRENFKDIADLKLYYDNVLNSTTNILYSLIYKLSFKNSLDKSSDTKPGEQINIKIRYIMNYLNNMKIRFNGSDKIDIKDHIINIFNNLNKNNINIEYDNLVDGKCYFIEILNDRIIKSEVIKKDNESFHIGNYIKIDKNKCIFYEYNPILIQELNFINLVKYLINNDNYIKYNLTKKIFSKDITLSDEKISNAHVNIFKYLFTENNNKLLLSSINVVGYSFVDNIISNYDSQNINFELDILEKGYEDKSFILYLSDKYKDNSDNILKILEKLFKNYNFPLTFNKKKLNLNFELIMYFSFLNINILIKVVDLEKIYLVNNVLSIIPAKLKNLYYCLLKFYYQYQYNSLENITYNFKFYQDYIYIYIIKNIIQKTTLLSDLFRKNEVLFKNLIKVYKTNFILTQMIQNISWHNLSDKMDYLEYLYKYNDYIWYQGKVNKNLFNDSVDYKVKSIIVDKFTMYKYLKKEKDFVKWTKFIKNYLNDLYDKNILITNDDLPILGSLLYKLLDLEVQDLKNIKYNEFILLCQTNKKLILSTSRINLKIKEKLPTLNCNLNLGFLAKHLNFNNHDKIEINSQITEVDKLEDKVNILTRKYQKYKHKYIKFKSDNSSSINTSFIPITDLSNIEI
jgi:hypothetical protein